MKDAIVDSIHCPYIDDHSQFSLLYAFDCSECARHNVATKKSSGDAHLICDACGAVPPSAPTPTDPGCTTRLNDDALAELLDNVTMAKLMRFREMKHNSNFRECPRCQFPNTSGSSFFSNWLTCGETSKAERGHSTASTPNEGCGHVYCFVHSDQHPGQSCRGFERASREVPFIL